MKDQTSTMNTDSTDNVSQKIIDILKLHDAPVETQQQIIVGIAQAADEKIALALGDILNDEQLQHVKEMEASGKSAEEIVEWITANLPEYDELLQLAMLDMAEQVARQQDLTEVAMEKNNQENQES